MSVEVVRRASRALPSAPKPIALSPEHGHFYFSRAITWHWQALQANGIRQLNGGFVALRRASGLLQK